MTSKLMITHYFAIELICIAMRSLQRWWLTTILLTDFSCCHYFVGRIRRTQCGGPRAMRAIFVAFFREPSSIYFVIELICIVTRSLQKWWLTTISWTDFRASHFFVGRIRRMQWGGPTKYKCVHENTLQQFKVISHFLARDKYTNPIFWNNLILKHIPNELQNDSHKILDLS